MSKLFLLLSLAVLCIVANASLIEVKVQPLFGALVPSLDGLPSNLWATETGSTAPIFATRNESDVLFFHLNEGGAYTLHMAQPNCYRYSIDYSLADRGNFSRNVIWFPIVPVTSGVTVANLEGLTAVNGAFANYTFPRGVFSFDHATQYSGFTGHVDGPNYGTGNPPAEFMIGDIAHFSTLPAGTYRVYVEAHSVAWPPPSTDYTNVKGRYAVFAGEDAMTGFKGSFTSENRSETNWYMGTNDIVATKDADDCFVYEWATVNAYSYEYGAFDETSHPVTFPLTTQCFNASTPSNQTTPPNPWIQPPSNHSNPPNPWVQPPSNYSNPPNTWMPPPSNPTPPPKPWIQPPSYTWVPPPSNETTHSNQSCTNILFSGSEPISTCGAFGDPHMILFDQTGVTCGNQTVIVLVDNPYFTIVGYAEFVSTTSAVTVLKSIGFTYKLACNPTTAIFDGNWGANLTGVNAPDAYRHELRVVGYNIYIDALYLRFQVRKEWNNAGLTFGISMPSSLVAASSGICAQSCPGDEVGIGGKRDDLASSFASLAVAACDSIPAGTYEYDSCVFDVGLTGNTEYANVASSFIATKAEMAETWTIPAAPPSWPEPTTEPTAEPTPDTVAPPTSTTAPTTIITPVGTPMADNPPSDAETPVSTSPIVKPTLLVLTVAAISLLF